MKSIFRGTKLLSFLLSLTNKHKPSTKPDIIVFSLPRSGSTWLMEIIWSQKGFKYVNEPLDLSLDWIRKYSKINSFFEYYNLDVSEKIVNYINDFKNGKNNFLNPNPFRKEYNFFTNRIVFKIIHGSDLYVDSIAEGTSAKCVYLLRHPFDVTLSRKKITNTKEINNDRVFAYFNDEQIRLIQNLLNNGTHLQKGVVTWCIHTKIALSNLNKNTIVVFYENLVLNYDIVVKTLFQFCELNDIEAMMRFQMKPSAVSIQSDSDSKQNLNDTDNRKLLVNKWISKLSNDEIKKLSEIIAVLEMDIYKLNTGDCNFSHPLLKDKLIAY